MGKSLGNFITLPDLFKEYDPIIIRFYILQNHYRKPTDLSKEQLNETAKIYSKLTESITNLRNKIKDATEFTPNDEIDKLKEKFIEAMNDDFNTGLAISYIFEASKLINKELTENKDNNKLIALNNFIIECAQNILGLTFENSNSNSKEQELIKIINDIRNKYREDKNYEEADKIRNNLNNIGITLNDRK